MDSLDRQIITATQAGIPLTHKPYHTIAHQLGMDVRDLMQRISRLLQEGKIRRIGAVPNHYKLGYTANAMSVWQVDEKKVLPLGNKIGQFDFVSHCYQRPQFLPEWPYNLFAMIHGKNKQEVSEKLQYIVDALGEDCLAHDLLYSTRILKKTGLRLKPKKPTQSV